MEENNQGQETQTEAKYKFNPILIVGLIVVVVVIVVGFLLFGRQQATTPTTPTSQQRQTTQQVPATPGSDVEETVVKEDGDVMEEEGAVMEAREIVVDGDEFSLSPASISVKAGEKIKLTFNNVGAFPHNFTVLGLGVATETIGAGQSDTIEFTVEEGGTYTTFCSVGNHRAQGMEGTLLAE